MKSKWFVVILPALMVALLLVPLAVPGFASEESASLAETAASPMEDASGTDTESTPEPGTETEEDTSTDCQKGNHHYRDGYGACLDCSATPTPAPTAGDMNGNASVGAEDVVSLVKFYLGNSDSIQARPDVNGDGELNLLDVVHYLKYLMGDVTDIISDPDVSPAYWREAAAAD